MLAQFQGKFGINTATHGVLTLMPGDEANKGKIKTRHKEVFLQSTVVNAVSVNAFKNAYNRNYVSDMDDRINQS